MASHYLKPGETKPRIPVRLRSSTTGQGLTGVAYGSVTAYYSLYLVDGTSSGPTTISFAANTVNGAYSSATWIQVSAANQPGVYQCDLPIVCCAATVRECLVTFVVSGAMDAHEQVLVAIPTDLRLVNGSAFTLLTEPLELTTGIFILPIQATVNTSPSYSIAGGTVQNLVFTQNSSVTMVVAVVDSNGDAVSLDGKTIRLLVHDQAEAVVYHRESDDSADAIAITGTSKNQIQITVVGDLLATTGKWGFKLWNATDLSLVMSGAWIVKQAPISAS